MKIINLIKKSKKVAVFGHQSPDGDCLGSISAISFLCKQYNKQVDAFIDDDVSNKYKFLDIDNLNKVDFKKENYDLFISVDVASPRLLGKFKDDFLNFENKIVIDHHSSRDLIAKVLIVDSNKASCCEVIYDIIKKTRKRLDSYTATMLYLGISDDTGCFLHDNTTQFTHLVAADLFKLGADYQKINYNIFKLQTKKSFDMNCMLNKQIFYQDDIVYSIVTYEFMQKNNFSKNDMGHYVNKLLNLENTKISFVITEKQQGIFSVSFRCIRGYDVSKIAQQFGGGGHKQASGGEIRGNLEECVDQLIHACKCAISIGDNNV